MPLPTDTSLAIYTDGACKPNPGPGGWAAIVLAADTRTEIAGGFRRTTNNRMEIFAAIAGLRSVSAPSSVTLFSDSQYLVKAMSRGWVKRWAANAWMRTATEAALNADLWRELQALSEQHDVQFRWVRGHASDRHNQDCDRLAGEASRRPSLPADSVYEQELLSGRPRGQWSRSSKPRQKTLPRTYHEMSPLDQAVQEEREVLRLRVEEQMRSRKYDKSRRRRLF